MSTSRMRCQRGADLPKHGRLGLDQGDQTGDRPGLTASGAGDQLGDVVGPRTHSVLRHPKEQSVTLTAATTQRGGADAPSAALEFERQV